MDFFETIEKRRSIRKFTETPFPSEKIQKALEAAVLAPNSSNTQTWDFHWVESPEMRQKLVPLCLGQSAARTASQLVVFAADPTHWKRSQKALIQWVDDAKAPKIVRLYYEKLIPLTYRWGFLHSIALFKWIMTTSAALVRPMARGPYGKVQLQEVAIKSAALAAENFVLAITAQGGATCMMEGFDEPRVKKLLGLGRHTRVAMIVAVGYEAERGTWGPRFRLPLHQVIHRH